MTSQRSSGLFCTLALTLAACGPAAEERASGSTSAVPAPPLDLARIELVDLGHAYDEATIYWPTSPQRFELETLAEGFTEDGYYYAAKSFSTPEHGGTHLDAPVHFAEHGWSVEEIPLARLLALAVVIDVTAEAAADPDYRLDSAKVLAWEGEHGRIEPGTIVLLRTGWSRHWPDADAYYGREASDSTELHFPAFGADAARLLVEERRVGMLGVDTASLDHGPSTDFVVHRIANGANVPGLENLTGLEALPARGFWVAALPMKIGGGTGAPVRAVALVTRSGP